MTDEYARVHRMLSLNFHREQSGKANRWNNEARSNSDGAKLSGGVDRHLALPRRPSPAPPMPDWREKLEGLELTEAETEMTEADTAEWRFEHGVGPEPGMVICQVCGNLLRRGLEKHPDCRPRIIYRGRGHD
jgi:hypothetical protein